MKKNRYIYIQISGLTNDVHEFDFELDKGFFDLFESNLEVNETFQVKVLLKKATNMITADLNISGMVDLVCDRCLENYQYPLKATETIFFKYGETHKELSENLFVIPAEQEALDLNQHVYDSIMLSIPMKKLHPRFLENESNDEEENTFIYSSKTDAEIEEEPQPDPRWAQLRKFISNN